MTTIYDLLEQAGFDYLLPYQKNTDIYDGFGREDASDFYDPDYDDDNDDDYEHIPQEDTGLTKEDVRDMFDCLDLTDWEFEQCTPWDLMNLTAHQFHKIDAKRLSVDNFRLFFDTVKSRTVRKALSDAEQRIHYATLIANIPTYISYGGFAIPEIK